MLRVREHVTLKDFTTLKVGGTARYFFSVSTAETLAEAVLFARGKKLPLVVLGGGSNVIVSDTLIDALVVKIEIQGIEWVEDVLKCRDFDILKSQHLNMSESQNSNISTSQNVLVVAGAGESWDALVGEAVKRGLWGIENLSGIPGTVGAAPIQNIGAYGAEIQNVLEWVEVFDAKTGKIRTLPNHECFFGYRDSIFKTPRGRDLIITRVALRLSKNGTPHLEYKDLKERFKNKDSGFKNPTVQEIRQAVLEIRIRKFPNLRQFGTAGSFFKNPIIPKRQFDELKKKYPDLVGYQLPRLPIGGQATTNYPACQSAGRQLPTIKVSLAWILDHICKLKGFKKGTVALFERQPIVLTAVPGATAEEIKKFAEEVIRRVHAKTGIAVEYEVIHIS